MQTTIKQVGPVEYELEITAPADELAPQFNKALRAQQVKAVMKGFRPGKVPLGLVKKVYGKALAYSLADKSIQETYEEAVLKAKEHEVLGQPVITRLDYEMDGDLHAVVQFGVRPEVELKDLSGETLTKLVHEVTDEEVEEELEKLRQERADLVPVEDEPAGETDLVVFDLQEVDPASQTPIIGKRDEDQTLLLDDPRLEENALLSALAKVLHGAKPGDVKRFQFDHDAAHGEHAGGHVHHFAATVKEIKRRDLPDLDDEFVQEVTGGQVEDLAALRAELRKQLEQVWERRTREFLESTIVHSMLELHPVPVPASAVEVYLDSFVADVKRRNEGALPENFSEEAFRRANQQEAEQQARWMLVRDQVIEEATLAVTDEDLDAFFEKEAGSDERITAAEMRKFYQSVPKLMEQVEQRVLSLKVFDYLAGQFEVVEKDRETIEREVEEKRERAASVAQVVMTESDPGDETA